MGIVVIGMRKPVAGMKKQLALLLITHGKKIHIQTQKPDTCEQGPSGEVHSPDKIL